MTTERPEPPYAAPERDMLGSWLDFHRATLARKCDGLTSEQLRVRSVPPSSLSLLGLIRHMAEVERGWFRQVLAGEDLPDLYATDRDPEADFNDTAAADADETISAWQAEIDAARRAEAACPSLEAFALRRTERGNEVTLRWIMVHMIEEYARHNGHADLLRERIDGVVGD
ncbi:MAG TPA: DinB family protein [Streptosporangiaceae bacterium]